MRRVLAAIALLSALILTAADAFAVNPDEVLADPALEARARHLSAELRCMVCQNQSIDDSNAELARDLRLLVRDRLVKGETDEAVLQYIVSRYGEFVLLRPRFSWRTALLWGAPALLVAAGGATLIVSLRARRRGDIEKLTPEEEERIERLLKE